jgi:hypothetical protein
LSTTVCAETGNPKAIWHEVISAVKMIQNPPMGKGSALVASTTSLGPSENHIAIMDFEFKSAMRRSDMFLATEKGEKGRRENTWAQGNEYAVTYNSANVKIDQKLTRGFYRKVGYDFHPETFLYLTDHPISFLLEKEVNGPGILSVTKDENGILNLICKYEDPNKRIYHLKSFDPSKGYRPVAMHDIVEFLKDHRKDINDAYTIEWAKYDSAWYVKSAKIEAVYWSKDSNAPAKMITEVAIQNFEPNVDIDSNDFNIEGLGVPKGTTVVDKIKNREYKYQEANLVPIAEPNNPPK